MADILNLGYKILGDRGMICLLYLTIWYNKSLTFFGVFFRASVAVSVRSPKKSPQYKKWKIKLSFFFLIPVGYFQIQWDPVRCVSYLTGRGWKNISTKLYVGNLDYGVTGDQLGEHFAQAGKVDDAVVISDRYSGRSKGFGFIEMSSEEEAKKAIEMFNGKDFGGRNIVVNEARPREPREGQPAGDR